MFSDSCLLQPETLQNDYSGTCSSNLRLPIDENYNLIDQFGVI